MDSVPGEVQFGGDNTDNCDKKQTNKSDVGQPLIKLMSSDNKSTAIVTEYQGDDDHAQSNQERGSCVVIEEIDHLDADKYCNNSDDQGPIPIVEDAEMQEANEHNDLPKENSGTLNESDELNQFSQVLCKDSQESNSSTYLLDNERMQKEKSDAGQPLISSDNKLGVIVSEYPADDVRIQFNQDRKTSVIIEEIDHLDAKNYCNDNGNQGPLPIIEDAEMHEINEPINEQNGSSNMSEEDREVSGKSDEHSQFTEALYKNSQGSTVSTYFTAHSSQTTESCGSHDSPKLKNELFSEEEQTCDDQCESVASFPSESGSKIQASLKVIADELSPRNERKIPSWLLPGIKRKNEDEGESEDFKKKRKCPLLKYHGNIFYSVTDLDCTNLCSEIIQAQPRFIGFDMEWPVEYVTGNESKTATVQICPNKEECYVFHLSEMNDFPSGLRKLIESKKILKVGLGIKNDFWKLGRDFNSLNVHNIIQESVVDLGELANEALKVSERWSLDGLCQNQLGLQLSKQSAIREGDWTEFPLPEKKKRYAATDAYASYILYKKLEK